MPAFAIGLASCLAITETKTIYAVQNAARIAAGDRNDVGGGNAIDGTVQPCLYPDDPETGKCGIAPADGGLRRIKTDKRMV